MKTLSSILSAAALLGALLWCAPAAQTGSFWPPVLVLPDSLVGDSTSRTLLHRQTLGPNTWGTADSLSWQTRAGDMWLQQTALYRLDNNHGLHMRSHSADLSGSVLWPSRPLPAMKLGLEWMPQLVYSRDLSVDAAADTDSLNKLLRADALGSLRIGPVLSLQYQNLPLRLSAGPALDIWQNGMPVDPRKVSQAAGNRDLGFYAHLSIGDPSLPLIAGLPLYAGGSIHGDYLDKSRITLGRVSGLFATDPSFADSLFVGISDTVSVGRRGYLGRASYSTVPDRSENVFSADIGLRDIGSLKLRPSLLYGLSLRRSGYMPYTGLVGDERFAGHRITTALCDAGGLPFSYRGWLTLTFNRLEALPGIDFGTYPLARSAETGSLIGGRYHDRDSLAEKARSFKGFGAELHQEFSATLFEHLLLSYRMQFERDRRLYTNPYVIRENADSSILEDKDRVMRQHIAEGGLCFGALTFGLLGEYATTVAANLSSALSAGNNTVRLVRLEPFARIERERLTLGGTVGASGQRTEWAFPAVHLLDYPSESRKFYGRLSVLLTPVETWGLELQGSEIYHDEGQYRAKEYQDPLIEKDRHSYYGISSKTLETNADLSSWVKIAGRVKIRVGDVFRYWIYNDAQISASAGTLSSMVNIPYMQIQARGLCDGRVDLLMKLRRTIDANADDYFDASTSLEAVF